MWEWDMEVICEGLLMLVVCDQNVEGNAWVGYILGLVRKPDELEAVGRDGSWDILYQSNGAHFRFWEC